MKIKYAYIETTNHCNLRCITCNRQDVIGPLKHMSLNDFSQIMAKLQDHPIQEAKLMGMGEPFLHPQFSDIVKTFKATFPGAKLISATNAQYKLTKNMENSLKYIDMLYISIDGANGNYERMRPPSKWNKLITFLEDLQKVNRYDCNIVVNYTVSPGIVYDIPIVEELSKKYNIGEVRLNLVQNWNEDESTTTGYTDEELKFLEKYKGQIKGRAPWTWSDCFWIKEGLYCTVEGNIKVCCMNTAAKSLGNIFEQSVDEIYNTKEFRVIRWGCKTDEPTTHCAKCSYKELSPLLERYV
jgi:MoaA/NifB/PqqE/SkfB family radical SAM enzyme